ncbi:alpha/beta hydrolase [Microscilla marina]|uniref:Esterase n=1 Tax=Microscilla marina ATCC 23134 TaxID=313606 RepID=A1ZQH4_MICM2|nr:alpha/beta hydrolase [Microscilla marina]EAY27346.1 esterase [Microscilla marina ATCC 23134]
MPSIKSHLYKVGLLWMKAKRKGRPFTLQEGRLWLEKAGRKFPVPPSTSITPVSAQGVPCEWIDTPLSNTHKVTLFFHGGAYAAGSLHSHRGLASRLARATGSRVLSVDYRLAPEHPFPAAISDTVTAYQWLLKQCNASQIALAGDSAGGGLVLATLLKLKEDQLELPTAGVLICPWLDLTSQNPNLDKLASRDPILYKSGLHRAAQMYAKKQDLKNPYISPLFGNLSGLPPLLVQVGALDMISVDGIALANRLKEMNERVQFEQWKNMVHVWHFLGDKLPEATQAMERIGQFVNTHWH